MKMEVVKKYEKCVWCNKSLVPIGHARLFGANHKDWYDRKCHKKCWIEHELKGKKKRPEGEYKRVIKLELTS